LPELPALYRSSFEAVVVYPSASVNLQGELKTYNEGDSGQQVRRRFCPNCGSGVIAEADVLPGVTIVLAGTLDDPSSYKPGMEIYCGSAQPWVMGWTPPDGICVPR
jgi:hypothetical protein